MQVTLSDNTIVTLKKTFSHKADMLLWDEFDRGVHIVRDEFGKAKSQEIPAGNVRRGYHKVLPLLIESPIVDEAWLDALGRDDYAKLYKAANQIYNSVNDEKEAGKKNH